MASSGLTLYSAGTPNGYKITILLEELGLTYEKQPSYLEINPNGRVPAMVDHDNKGLALFESGNIMLYLVERYGKGRLLGLTDAERYTITGWLFWQMSALGPTFGQIFDTTYFVKPVNTAMLERIKAEASRQLGVMEAALAKHKYLAGETYSIADIACFPLVASMAVLGLSVYDFPHLAKWTTEILGRPAGALMSGNVEVYTKIVNNVMAVQQAV
ncbi:MAG: hypothetical protein WDW38_006233 [Sanguina aurantia]